MNTHAKLAEIKAQLLEIHKNDNDGPRLIAEMVADLPNPRKVWNEADGHSPAQFGMHCTTGK